MNTSRKPVVVVVGATSKWQSDGRNTKLAHGKVLDDSDIPVGIRWGVGGAIAQKFANEIAGGERIKVAAKRSARRLQKMSAAFSQVTTLVTTVADVSGFKPESSVSDKRITHFGLGVAQGDPDLIGEIPVVR